MPAFLALKPAARALQLATQILLPSFPTPLPSAPFPLLSELGSLEKTAPLTPRSLLLDESWQNDSSIRRKT